MATVVLLRHGLTAMTGPLLAGWTPGLHLDDRGRAQAEAVAARLRPLRLDAVLSSPLDRCLDTAQAVVAGRDGAVVQVEDRLGECRYGDWTGRRLVELRREPLWRVLEHHPSSAVFPGPEGEPLRETQHRAVTAVREVDARLGPDATWLACSHGDVIKAVVADALGMHLDLVHRLLVEPCSITVVRYERDRPTVLRLNDVGGDVADLLPRKRRRSNAAAVGGGATAA